MRRETAVMTRGIHEGHSGSQRVVDSSGGRDFTVGSITRWVEWWWLKSEKQWSAKCIAAARLIPAAFSAGLKTYAFRLLRYAFALGIHRVRVATQTVPKSGEFRDVTRLGRSTLCHLHQVVYL